MKLNKEIQYSLMLVFYLVRAGRATISAAAESMDIPRQYLQQISLRLKKAGVVKSVRGPGGGYELVGEPTIRDVFDAVAPITLLDGGDFMKYTLGNIEGRSLVLYSKSLKSALNPILNRKAKNVVQELFANDTAKMNTLDLTAKGH